MVNNRKKTSLRPITCHKYDFTFDQKQCFATFIQLVQFKFTTKGVINSIKSTFITINMARGEIWRYFFPFNSKCFNITSNASVTTINSIIVNFVLKQLPIRVYVPIVHHDAKLVPSLKFSIKGKKWRRGRALPEVKVPNVQV